MQAQGDALVATVDTGAKVAVEEWKVFDKVVAGTVKRGSRIEQVGQAVGGRGDKTPACRQADQRVAGMRQGQGPEAP
ncbi:hypothetical protein D3C78_1548040 [compost metagenome]